MKQCFDILLIVTNFFRVSFFRPELAHQDMLLFPYGRNPVVSTASTPVSVHPPAPAPSNPPPMDAGPPFKKIRLGDAKQEMQPLRVDTRVSAELLC